MGMLWFIFKRMKKKQKDQLLEAYLTVMHTGNFNCAPKTYLSVFCFCIVCSQNRLL